MGVQQQMATPRAGDNRVAAQMDGRHVHNKQPPTPSAHFTFVKWAAPLWRWMGRREARGYLAEKPATWTFRLRVPRFQGLRPSARHGSRSRPAGLMVGIKKNCLLGLSTLEMGRSTFVFQGGPKSSANPSPRCTCTPPPPTSFSCILCPKM